MKNELKKMIESSSLHDVLECLGDICSDTRLEPGKNTKALDEMAARLWELAENSGGLEVTIDKTVKITQQAENPKEGFKTGDLVIAWRYDKSSAVEAIYLDTLYTGEHLCMIDTDTRQSRSFIEIEHKNE